MPDAVPQPQLPATAPRWSVVTKNENRPKHVESESPEASQKVTFSCAVSAGQPSKSITGCKGRPRIVPGLLQTLFLSILATKVIVKPPNHFTMTQAYYMLDQINSNCLKNGKEGRELNKMVIHAKQFSRSDTHVRRLLPPTGVTSEPLARRYSGLPAQYIYIYILLLCTAYTATTMFNLQDFSGLTTFLMPFMLCINKIVAAPQTRAP